MIYESKGNSRKLQWIRKIHGCQKLSNEMTKLEVNNTGNSNADVAHSTTITIIVTITVPVAAATSRVGPPAKTKAHANDKDNLSTGIHIWKNKYCNLSIVSTKIVFDRKTKELPFFHWGSDNFEVDKKDTSRRGRKEIKYVV